MKIPEVVRAVEYAVMAAVASADVISVYLFGSYSLGAAHRESDVDLGVLLRRSRYPTVGERFETGLQLAVRLRPATGREVDVVVLNDAPPLLARRIVTAGQRIFCADPEADHAFVRDVQLRAADVAPFLRRMQQLKLAALAR